MAIIKNEIPILEFDTEQTAVLNPTHENLGLNLPKKCVFAFLGAYIDEYASKSDTKQVSTFESATKHYPIYITKYKGEDIVLCQAPVGAAAATQILDWLIGYGVRSRQVVAVLWKSSPKVHSSYQTRLCVMREHLITMRPLLDLWKSARRQEKQLKKPFLSIV